MAAARGVEYVGEVITPFTSRDAGPATGPPAITSTSCGSTTSEGDAQLKADQARSTYAVDGTGVKVGGLSDSYDKWFSASTHTPAM